jgi:RHH-type proline utilization regulon transcriptional repressor/proline dehydrogenase/delta 1-pyrroline-5-carboxylate dehydrogenase
VQLLGQQFVLGQDIEEAMARAQHQRQTSAPSRRLRFSFDMLGEGARTWEDAERYFQAYQGALSQLAVAGAARSGSTGTDAPRPDGLSIKLSALHPRFDVLHTHSVMAQLLPRLTALATQAALAGLQLTLDAEESWRLELQLNVLDALLEQLKGIAPADDWHGLGLAVQAYQHRALPAIDEVARLARQHGRPLTIRLVKGAYWDAELKRAQELGLPGFPVYTHKAHTDLSYLACAHQLLTHHPHVLPQFATHNAATVAAVMQLAQRLNVQTHALQWQRLQGMGEATWREIMASQPSMDLCIYAPVGSHRELLAYLVRRLLENGANTSFVHQLADHAVPMSELLASPLAQAAMGPMGDGLPTSVALPHRLFGATRANSKGLDVHHAPHRATLNSALPSAFTRFASPSVESTPEEAEQTMSRLHTGVPDWEQLGPARCEILEHAANRLEHDFDSWAADLVAEGGKTWADAIAEVRETIDFARYYAQQAREWLQPRDLPGPTGEHNQWRLRPRGVWVCIAPWNFPLAIFAGQVMAALVMGNAVAAKPAEQTPRIARRFTDLLLQEGVPSTVLACLCGSGASVGEALVKHPACAGVAFTGSVRTGLRLQQVLSHRSMERPHPIVPLIAETGGLNALIADSTALPEQLLDTVLGSAFASAGQRCSALRLLCVHTALADAFEAMLEGALRTLVVGTPSDWTTDVGPVIDERARQLLEAHTAHLASLASLRDSGVRLIGQSTPPDVAPNMPQPFVAPSAWSIPRVDMLTDEHFGPILHVVRWGPGCEADSLDALIDRINATGFGLTLGVHTRIDARVEHVARRVRVGNVYVNRGMTGAVVGSQPFGGQGLSGTGPKAGGPLYLPRFATEQVVCVNTAAAGGNAALMTNPTIR